jgi:hypothetical protein
VKNRPIKMALAAREANFFEMVFIFVVKGSNKKV